MFQNFFKKEGGGKTHHELILKLTVSELLHFWEESE